MPAKHVILVAGYNYMRWVTSRDRERAQREGRTAEADGTSFLSFCDRRRDYLLKKMPDATFSVFDVGAGTLRLIDKDERGKRRDTNLIWRNPVAPGRWRNPVSYVSNYDRDSHEFTKNHHGVTSIVDVYDYVKEIGRPRGGDLPERVRAATAPGALIELSIFSHGWIDGPVLVNTSEPAGLDDLSPRGPNDRDGRRKDFNHVNLPQAQAVAFRDAFSAHGYVWIWGCFATQIYKRVYQEMAERPPNLAKERKTASGDDNAYFSFSLDFLFDCERKGGCKTVNEWLTEIQTQLGKRPRHYRSFFPDPQAATKLTFSQYLQAIKAFYAAGLNYTYMRAIADAARVPTYGALPGMEAATSKQKDCLMGVPKELQKKFYSRFIAFYKKYMNTVEDPESRGYAVYKPRALFR
jgi:hypothetical protein